MNILNFFKQWVADYRCLPEPDFQNPEYRFSEPYQTSKFGLFNEKKLTLFLQNTLF